MAKKKVRGSNKSKDVASNDKDIGSSGGGERVLRSRNTTKEGANADEKAKGKVPVVRKGSLKINDDRAQKGGRAGKRKVTAEEEKGETDKPPAKRSRNATENKKGKSVSGGSDWVLRPHNPRQGTLTIGEKAKGKRKLVAEEGNEEQLITPAKKRGAGKEIADPNMPSAEKGSYNLRARKAVPSFQRVGLSESGFAMVVGKRVKVFKSGSRKWVTGEIKLYHNEKKLHKVLYVDGESEELDMRSQRFEVEIMPGEASTLCSNPGAKMATNAGRSKRGNAEEKAENGASSSGAKPSRKTKKGEGPINVEKRKGRSNSKTKK